jgi:hypothetical protein
MALITLAAWRARCPPIPREAEAREADPHSTPDQIAEAQRLATQWMPK